MENIPDLPIIRNCERYGYPDGPEDEIEIKCPICLKEAEEFVFNLEAEIVGCNNCISYYDAFDWYIEHGEDELCL